MMLFKPFHVKKFYFLCQHNLSNIKSLYYNLNKSIPNSHCIFSTFPVLSKEVPTRLKGRSKSSQEWITRQLNDPYVKKAKIYQYRCRSAFKLIEIDDKFKFLSPGMCTVDCGASPGSWTQVLVGRCNANGLDASKPKGTVISIDKNFLLPVEGATILSECDFTLAETQEKVKSLLFEGGADAVLSDMAPHASGVKELDHEVIAHLAYTVLRFALQVSRPGANCIVKLWEGRLAPNIQNDMARFYDQVKVVKPDASRSDSAEMFLFGKGFKGLK